MKAGVSAYAKRGVNTGAMLVMNPDDGEILAMVGSADYNNAAIRGQINLTGMDPLGWRGVGSSFKLYTYAAALQAGIVTPASLLNDQTAVIGGHAFSDWDGKHEGFITLRTALAESRNLPALWTYAQEGGSRVIALMHNLGVTAQIENPDGVATTLGHDPISMAEHLAAYSAFDNGGYRISPHAVLRVTDANGRVLEALDPNAPRTQVISPELGYMMTDLLRGPVKLYLGNLGSKPVAGKSGTTEAYTGSIYIGYTPNLAVAASLMHIDAGPACKSGYAYLATNFPPSGMGMPDCAVVRRERRDLRMEAVPRAVLLDASVARDVGPAAWSGDAAGLSIRRRIHRQRRVQRDLSQGHRRAAVPLRRQPSAGRSSIPASGSWPVAHATCLARPTLGACDRPGRA